MKYLTGDSVIPEAVTYNGTSYVVKKMIDYAFEKTHITSITLPEGIWGGLTWTDMHEGLETLADFTGIQLPETFMGTTVDLRKFKALESLSGEYAPYLETVLVGKDQNIDIYVSPDVKVVAAD